jgi:hypothetical protein
MASALDRVSGAQVNVSMNFMVASMSPLVIWHDVGTGLSDGCIVLSIAHGQRSDCLNQF